MMLKNNSKTGTLLLAGLATGAAAWYLLGTANGKKTISQVSGSLKGFSDTAVSKANDTFANLKSKINNHNL